jgi:hypothetical protein
VAKGEKGWVSEPFYIRTDGAPCIGSVRGREEWWERWVGRAVWWSDVCERSCPALERGGRPERWGLAMRGDVLSADHLFDGLSAAE